MIYARKGVQLIVYPGRFLQVSLSLSLSSGWQSAWACRDEMIKPVQMWRYLSVQSAHCNMLLCCRSL